MHRDILSFVHATWMKSKRFSATKEVSYLQAIAAAGTMYHVTKSCHHKDNALCGCGSGGKFTYSSGRYHVTKRCHYKNNNLYGRDCEGKLTYPSDRHCIAKTKQNKKTEKHTRTHKRITKTTINNGEKFKLYFFHNDWNISYNYLSKISFVDTDGGVSVVLL